jgi:hypothetical protein
MHNVFIKTLRKNLSCLLEVRVVRTAGSALRNPTNKAGLDYYL